MPTKIIRFIKKDPRIKGGMPVISGTRVTVAEILNYLENEKTVNDVIKQLKGEGVLVTKEEVFAALEFAKYKSSYETPSKQNSK